MSEILNVQVMGRAYPVTVEHDEATESPREWGNLGTLACLHRVYKLGDEELPSNDYCSSMRDHLSIVVYERFMSNLFSGDYLDENQCVCNLNRAGLDRAWRWGEQNMIALPVYLYDHSGLALSTAPFSCSWDSGQLGFIFCTKDQARQELGVKRLTAQHNEQIKTYLRNEVDVYSEYLSGSVYQYYNDEFSIGCGGFYGYDHDKSGLLESAASEITWKLQQKMRAHHQKLKAQIAHKVPLQYRQPLPI
jgi:hypothetical protein